ncbi:MAG: hypothetical protein ACRYFB_13275 [Janthinobacterium lividum]
MTNFYPGFCLTCRLRNASFVGVFLLLSQLSIAQNTKPKFNLYEQASEVSGLVIQHHQDLDAIKDFYAPYNLNPNQEEQEKAYVLNSPEERQRLVEVNQDYLQKLDQVDFEQMSIYGKVDYILLKKTIDFDLGALKKEEEKYQQITKFIPFATEIYELEKKRRRGLFFRLIITSVTGHHSNVLIF